MLKRPFFCSLLTCLFATYATGAAYPVPRSQDTTFSRVYQRPKPVPNPRQFHEGDLYICAAVADGGCSSGAPGILRYSPRTNSVQRLFLSYGIRTGALEYDPFRDRLLAYTGSLHVSEIDAAGNVTNLIQAPALFDMAATGAGEVYFTTGGGLWYINAQDAVQPVFDQATGNPYGFSQAVQVEYDANSHSVLAVEASLPCSMSTVPGILQLFLSSDGSEVIGQRGPYTIGSCGLTALSLDPGLNGKYLMVESQSSIGIYIEEICPSQVFSSTLFAKAVVNGYAFGTGTYSEVLQGAVCIASPIPELQLLTRGTCGLGVVLQTSSNYPNSCLFHGASDIEEIRF